MSTMMAAFEGTAIPMPKRSVGQMAVLGPESASMLPPFDERGGTPEGALSQKKAV